MADFHQSGVITTLHRLGAPGLDRLERQLLSYSHERPIALVRTWYKRSIRLRTWDRTAIPLPFNRIKYYLAGPYHVTEDAQTEEGFARFLLQLEDELIEMATASYRDMGQPLPENLSKRTPEERLDIAS